MSSVSGGRPARAYWRSLEDLADTPEFQRWVRDEFPVFADEMATPQSRRRFLKLMGASVALAGMASCRWPVEEIVPFAHRPEGYTPGVPRQYATAMELAGVATGLLVTSYDGRPVKIEGNPNHPFSRGATDALAQASLLELYDPDRSRSVVRHEDGGTRSTGRDEFAGFASSHFADLRRSGGGRLVVLAEASSSPSLGAMRDRLLQGLPEAAWVEYEPLSRDQERIGSTLAFGTPQRVRLSLDRARVIAAFDADLLRSHPAAVRHVRDFARGRRPVEGGMSRLYAVEGVHSLTGSVADHRLPVPPSRVGTVLCRLAADLFVERGLEIPTGPGGARLREILARLLDRREPSGFETALARDLWSHRGASVIAVGPSQPAEVHALAHLLNEALGNTGRTVRYTQVPDDGRPSHAEAVRRLTDAMANGRVDTLLILGGNPVYDAPADLEFDRHLESVGTSIHLSHYLNETSGRCHWHVPRAHYLESWGDARAWDGTVSVVQPLISPLWGGMTPIEVLALVAGESRSGHEIVRDTFRQKLVDSTGGDEFETSWRRTLHDGLVEQSGWPETTPVARVEPWVHELAAHTGESRAAAVGDGGFEIAFVQDSKVHDGRFANNGWLQELPDPLTKVTWDNVLAVGPSDAAALRVSDGDLVRVSHAGREVELPVLVLPGQAAGSVAAAVGYGRRAAGSVGDGVGVDVYRIRTSASMHAARCTLERTGGRYPLACTQDHWAIDPLGAAERAERQSRLAREVDLDAFLHDPEHAVHAGGEHHLYPLWTPHEYPDHRWAMSIDLNACVGCGGCVVACQAENNIPVVGKEEVSRGHEMHWIRVDRYFSGDPESASVHHQPVTCHHCENAPCESVCPVAATVHDREGLNVMVYNRCIGTRYCSNNCPYKVRRFNWFNYHRELRDVEQEPLKMVYNPEVTVRGRGVMEKCSFCVQRISTAKIRAKNEGREVEDGEIVPACAQACPAQAIVFGNLNDDTSRVRRLHEDARSYAMIEEQNTQPRLRYLARVRNPAVETEGSGGSRHS